MLQGATMRADPHGRQRPEPRRSPPFIGVAQPVSIKVDTFGTGDEEAAADFVRQFDFRPGAIIERFDLTRPIYRQTTNYGHFGKPSLPWEQGL